MRVFSWSYFLSGVLLSMASTLALVLGWPGTPAPLDEAAVQATALATVGGGHANIMLQGGLFVIAISGVGATVGYGTWANGAGQKLHAVSVGLNLLPLAVFVGYLGVG